MSQTLAVHTARALSRAQHGSPEASPPTCWMAWSAAHLRADGHVPKPVAAVAGGWWAFAAQARAAMATT